MVLWQNYPEYLSDAELLAAWHHACEVDDDAAMDRLSAKIEKRGLDL